MKIITWLLSLADGKTLKFSLALLFIAIAALAAVIKYQEKEAKQIVSDCTQERIYYIKKIDSLTLYYSEREIKANDEMKSVLTKLIEEYKERVQNQNNINSKINSTLKSNDSIIRNNKIIPK